MVANSIMIPELTIAPNRWVCCKFLSLLGVLGSPGSPWREVTSWMSFLIKLRWLSFPIFHFFNRQNEFINHLILGYHRFISSFWLFPMIFMNHLSFINHSFMDCFPWFFRYHVAIFHPSFRRLHPVVPGCAAWGDTIVVCKCCQVVTGRSTMAKLVDVTRWLLWFMVEIIEISL